MAQTTDGNPGRHTVFDNYTDAHLAYLTDYTADYIRRVRLGRKPLSRSFKVRCGAGTNRKIKDLFVLLTEVKP